MLYVPLSTIVNPLELRSIVSLGTACCTNDRQGSPPRPLPNAWLVVVSFGQCRKRHRHEEFLSFLRLIDREVPAELDIHLVLDNYATHKHAKVKRWLAARPRFHLHFTPTSASWLNQVERWFGLLSQRAIKAPTARRPRPTGRWRRS